MLTISVSTKGMTTSFIKNEYGMSTTDRIIIAAVTAVATIIRASIMSMMGAPMVAAPSFSVILPDCMDCVATVSSDEITPQAPELPMPRLPKTLPTAVSIVSVMKSIAQSTNAWNAFTIFVTAVCMTDM